MEIIGRFFKKPEEVLKQEQALSPVEQLDNEHLAALGHREMLNAIRVLGRVANPINIEILATLGETPTGLSIADIKERLINRGIEQLSQITATSIPLNHGVAELKRVGLVDTIRPSRPRRHQLTEEGKVTIEALNRIAISYGIARYK